jgi:hypothetical protein
MSQPLDYLKSFANENNILSNWNMAFLVQLSIKGMSLLGISPILKQSEKYSWQNKISSIVLESGVEISDHIINGPLTISQTFIISVMSTYGIPGTVKVIPIVYLLMELRKTKQLISVLTSYGIYRNMIIESIETELMEGMKDALVCDITFREAIFAKTEESSVSVTNQNKKTLATKNKIFNKSASALKSGNLSIQS